MEPVKPIPGFDCVEMKRKGAERIYEALKNLSPEQKEAYWRERNEEFEKRMAEGRAETPEVNLAS